jgi:hypothetical protein
MYIVKHVPPPQPVVYKPLNSLNLRKLGAYSSNPLKLTKKGPLSDIPVYDGELLEDVKQIDNTVYQIDIVDEDGKESTYTLVIPDKTLDD